MPGRTLEPVKESVSAVLVCYVVACGVALVVLKIFNPLAWLRLFATDYLIGFLFLAGCVLLLTRAKARDYIRGRPVSISHAGAGFSPRLNFAAVFKAAAAAAFVILVLGKLVAGNVLHASLSDGRWWRFTVIAAAGFPLFFSDELLIRRFHPRWKPTFIAILTRLLLLAFLLTGVLTLNRQDAFLVLIVPVITVFWIALWFGAGVVHRHTGDPVAAALFATIVQGWAFAAWFVTM